MTSLTQDLTSPPSFQPAPVSISSIPPHKTSPNTFTKTIAFSQSAVTIDLYSTQTIYPESSSPETQPGTIKLSETTFIAIISAVILGSLILAAIVFFIAGRRRTKPHPKPYDSEEPSQSTRSDSPIHEQDAEQVPPENDAAQSYLSAFSFISGPTEPHPRTTLAAPPSPSKSSIAKSSTNDTQSISTNADPLELPSTETHHDVSKWTIDQVQRWLVALGFNEDDRRIFIDGSTLVELSDWILRDETGMGEGRLKNALLEIRARFVMDGKV
ncbi:hypothetical protein HDU97_008553 [Phlyctochytrium planicorne]|nr:hypothetical protein HDU97_008553 [Phlyctochytrium planicorne]